VFVEADALVLDIYRVTTQFPKEERFALQSHLVGLSIRLGFLKSEVAQPLARRYSGVQAGLYEQVESLK